MSSPTLHLLCGKIAAGKSTLAARLAEADATVLIAEDAWLHALYGEEMTRPADFLRCSARLRAAMAPHIATLLRSGLSVVLDFQANTVESRAWMRGIVAATGAAHILHLLDPPDAVCLDRLRARNESGTHPFPVTEAQYHRFAKHFVPPGPEEGFTIRRHDHAG